MTEISEAIVEAAARKSSRKRFPSGDGSAEDEAWYWSDRFDHPGNTFEHECRDEDRLIARSCLEAAAGVSQTSSEEMARAPRDALRRAATLVRLLTVRQVIEAGGDAIDAAGLNPWAMNEGLSDGSERISPAFLDDLESAISVAGDRP